jgi:hypothetical protein
LAEESVELPAGGIEGTLKRFFRFQSVDKRPTLLIDAVIENLLEAFPFERRVSFRSRMISPPNAQTLSTCL